MSVKCQHCGFESRKYRSVNVGKPARVYAKAAREFIGMDQRQKTICLNCGKMMDMRTLFYPRNSPFVV